LAVKFSDGLGSCKNTNSFLINNEKKLIFFGINCKKALVRGSLCCISHVLVCPAEWQKRMCQL
jgi:hypothetical protein